jgi:transcriptional regulator with XRE-family HTH domain
MGYGGKVVEQQRARELRAEAWTLQDIATELGVAKASVSLWVRDVEFVPNPRRRTRPPRPTSLHLRKLAEIERCNAEGIARIGLLSDREFLVLGLALYAGEGAKRDGKVSFANTDPRMLFVFVTWLRRYFDVDESRLRVRLYLHENLDLEVANEFWSQLLAIPMTQFGAPYRAPADASIRKAKHLLGCPAVIYSCSLTHRRVIGMMAAVLSPSAFPG